MTLYVQNSRSSLTYGLWYHVTRMPEGKLPDAQTLIGAVPRLGARLTFDQRMKLDSLDAHEVVQFRRE